MRFTLFLVFMTALSSVCRSEDNTVGDHNWPGWLGPGRDGKVLGVTPPDPWPEKLEQGWEVEVGEGYGTPLVQGERIFQHARQGRRRSRAVLGTRDWQRDLASGFFDPF